MCISNVRYTQCLLDNNCVRDIVSTADIILCKCDRDHYRTNEQMKQMVLCNITTSAIVFNVPK